jgi:site-specific DNA recombinase
MKQNSPDYGQLSTGPKFFVAPRLGFFSDNEPPATRPRTTSRIAKRRGESQKMRYAAYVRISSEDQVGNFSLDAQQRAIEAWVVAKGGFLVQIYKDEAKTGRSADRPAFQQMRRDARKGKFDAVVVHKFDRFARNRTDALAIKSLLRYDYGVKVFSVSEPSEDSDGPMGALIEGIMESVADWYSKNLATEVAKGKKERSLQGLHNNGAPFGMKKNDQKVLVPDEKELPGLLLAFELYATEKYSDTDIAHILNEKGYQTKRGRPFSKDTVRDFLRNPIYLGKVRYQQCNRNADGTRIFTGLVEWFDGQHQPVISEELFNQCQAVREKRVRHRQATIKYNPYLLRNLVYCYECCCKRPDTKTFPSYGKMRAQAYEDNAYRCYRCRARELGYACSQKKVRVETLDQQVINILLQLKPPAHWRQSIANSIGELLGEKDLQQRLEEIRSVIKRMDSRWDLGFITDEQEYLRQRLELQQELERLTPVDTNDLEKAADLLDNFPDHWRQCEHNVEAQAALIGQIIERVYVHGEEVVAMTLHSNCHLVLAHKTNEPTAYTVDPFILDQSLPNSPVEAEMDSCGLDGI